MMSTMIMMSMMIKTTVLGLIAVEAGWDDYDL